MIMSADAPRPRLQVPGERLHELADLLASNPGERLRFMDDPAGWMRARGVPVRHASILDSGPPPAPSEVCTVNAACNVNSLVNVNAATKVNAVSAVNAAITANAAAFVNFIAAYRTLVFNQSRFWGAPVYITVPYIANASLGRDDGLV